MLTITPGTIPLALAATLTLAAFTATAITNTYDSLPALVPAALILGIIGYARHFLHLTNH